MMVDIGGIKVDMAISQAILEWVKKATIYANIGSCGFISFAAAEDAKE